MSESDAPPRWLKGLGEYLGLLKDDAGNVRRPPWVEHRSLQVIAMLFAVLMVVTSVVDLVRDGGFWALFRLVGVILFCAAIGMEVVRHWRVR